MQSVGFIGFSATRFVGTALASGFATGFVVSAMTASGAGRWCFTVASVCSARPSLVWASSLSGFCFC
jgi:hypothetical protein